MASSNRHWPSMFRSKPVAACSAQPQGDMGNSSAATSVLSGSATGYSLKNPFSSGCEERSPEPKPRWNPKPEQIRILEAIFNSGMVNPPRDEIRRIRLQLQEYGQVGDANVFYWFQNRKSRSKNKQRAAGAPPGRPALSRACASPAAAPVTPPPQQPQIIAPVAPTSSSSSSSDRSSGSSKPVKLTTPTAPAAAHGTLSAAAMDLLSPLPAPAPTPALAPCQTYYHTQPPVPELAAPEPLLLQWAQGHYMSATELAGIVSAHAPSPMLSPASPEVFLGMYSEVFGQNGCHRNYPKGLGQYWCSSTELSKSTVPREEEEEQKGKLGLLQYGFGVTAATAAAAAALPLMPPVDAVATVPNVTTAGVPSAAASSVATTTTSALNDHLQGLTEAGVVGGEAPMAATVAVARGAVVCTSTAQYNVPAMHINVRLFGEAAVLFRHTGEPVLVDDSGVTVEPLQHGAIYYVLVD